MGLDAAEKRKQEVIIYIILMFTVHMPISWVNVPPLLNELSCLPHNTGLK